MKLREVSKLEWWTKTYKNCDNKSDEVLRVFKSEKFLVQVRRHRDTIRLCVNKIDRINDVWEDGITWDELQEIKNQCGYKDFWMCEYYPPKDAVVNVANIRHLWLMESAPENELRDKL